MFKPPTSELFSAERSVPNGELQVTTARSFAEVEALRPIWSARPSAHRDSDIDFCLDVDWIRKGVLRPHVLVVSRNGQPETVLVGRLERLRMTFKVGYLPLPAIPCRTFVFSYHGLLGSGSDENCRLLITSVIASLRQGEADVSMLAGMPLESHLYRSALRIPKFLSRDSLPVTKIHGVMELPESIEDVYGRMSSKHRKNLKREAKQFFAEGQNARVVCYSKESELEVLFRDAELIATKTYQRGMGVGFMDNPSIRHSLGQAARRGWLRANLLYLGERPVAFWIGALYRNTFVSDYMGYDPELRRRSPGMVLIMRVIEGFCHNENGDCVREIDFGSGSADYKESLSTRSPEEATVLIFRPSLKGCAVKVTRMVAGKIDGIARKLLGPAQQALRRAWRNRLANRATAVSARAGTGASGALEEQS